MSVIGQKIKQLREKKKWSQRDLAEISKMSASVLNRIELGKRPVNDQEIKTFADIFDVTTDFLLGRPTDNSSVFSEEEIMDPELDLMFKEMKEDSERREQLKKIWRIIKNEDHSK